MVILFPCCGWRNWDQFTFVQSKEVVSGRIRIWSDLWLQIWYFSSTAWSAYCALFQGFYSWTQSRLRRYFCLELTHWKNFRTGAFLLTLTDLSSTPLLGVEDKLVAQTVKNLPTMQETWVWSLEKEMATHSSILDWGIPWTKEPGGYCACGRKESDTTERVTPFTLGNSAGATGLEKVSFHSTLKEGQCQRIFKLLYSCAHFNPSKVMLNPSI